MSTPTKEPTGTRVERRVDRPLLRAVRPVVVAAAALALGGWWLTHPAVFGEGGSITGAPVAVGEVVHVGAGIRTREAVRLNYRQGVRYGRDRTGVRVEVTAN